MMKRRDFRNIFIIAMLLMICIIMCACAKEEKKIDYSGVYNGYFDIFSLTLTLTSDGKYTFKQYEPYTGGITESGKYVIEGNEIRYYTSSGSSLKYTGYIDGTRVTVGELEMTRK